MKSKLNYKIQYTSLQKLITAKKKKKKLMQYHMFSKIYYWDPFLNIRGDMKAFLRDTTFYSR